MNILANFKVLIDIPCIPQQFWNDTKLMLPITNRHSEVILLPYFTGMYSPVLLFLRGINHCSMSKCPHYCSVCQSHFNLSQSS